MPSLDRLVKLVVIHAIFPLAVLGAVCYLSGCNNTCVFGVVNPPNNSVTAVGGNAVASACSAAPITGVTVGGNIIGSCTNCSTGQQVAHAYLVVGGIEFHPGAVADANSPDWRELSPELALHPRLVDLVNSPTSQEVAPGLGVSGRIPAGKYYEVRLELAEASALPKPAAELLADKGCPLATHFGCILNADGSAHELRMLDGQQFLLVQAATPIDLQADEQNLVQFQFRPEWLLQQTARGIELAPMLLGEVSSKGTGSSAK